jgi:hypothetical protein
MFRTDGDFGRCRHTPSDMASVSTPFFSRLDITAVRGKLHEVSVSG